VELHFLGTTGYHPNNERQTACLMLPEIGVIFDAGTGMFRVRELLRTVTLDIFLTHVHLDHVIGLTFLYDVLFQRDMQRVTVHVGRDKIDAIRDHLYAERLFPVPPNYEICALDEHQTVTLRHHPYVIQVKTIPVAHPGGCLAFRLDGLPEGRSLAYVTDTMADLAAPYVKELAGIDTLIHECYFPDGWEDRAALTGHSCLTPVAEVARAANAGCCYLVHLNPLTEGQAPLPLESVEKIYSRMHIPADREVIQV
jgi:ribonuclease BN (tRNA processing enzyme)